MDSATLQIILTAKDQASAALETINEQLGLIGTAATEATATADAALGTLDASLKATADAATTSLVKIDGEMVETATISEEMASRNAASLALMTGSMQKSETEMSTLSKTAALVGIAVAGYLGYQAVKSAGDFQVQLTKLSTTAGESQSNLQMVGTGIMKLSSDTGTGIKELSDAMYTIESAGNHGAAGLTILKAAAQGAKAENSDLATVADAVTSVLKDYNLPADQAANVTSKLVAAVGAGKTNFNDFTGALHSVLPLASAAHISLDDIAGSMASMTIHGVSAQQAAENMADAIRHLQNPTQPMITELAQLGLTSNDVSDSLSSKGLSGTMEMLSETILNKMGPSGKVLLNALNTSKDAAKDANDMIKAMPASLQSLATKFQDGKISLADYRDQLKALPTDQAQLMQQFASLQNRASGFSNTIKAGGPDAQTYAAALQKATGDASSLNVALQITGENSAYTASAIKAVSGATAEAGNNVKGWSEIQGNMNFKMQQAKEAVLNTGTAIGTALLPTVTTLLKGIDDILIPIATWAENNRQLATIIIGLGVALTAAVITLLTIPKAITSVNKAFNDMKDTIAGMSKLMDVNPWILALTAVALIAILVITHWNEVKSFFEKFADSFTPMKGALQEVKHIFDDLADAFKIVFMGTPAGLLKLDPNNPTIKALTAINDVLREIVKIIIVQLKGVFSDLGAIFTMVANEMKPFIDGIVQFVEKHSEGFKSAIKDIAIVLGVMLLPAILSIVAPIALFVGAFTLGLILVHKGLDELIQHASTVKTIIVDTFKIIGAAILVVLFPISILIAAIVEMVKHWSDIKQAGADAWNGIKTAWNAAGDFFVRIWSDIKSGMTKFKNFIVDFFKDEWQGMVIIWQTAGKWFGDLWQDIKTAIGKLAGFIVEFFQNEWNGWMHIFGVIGDVFSSLWQGIKTAIGAFGGFIVDFFQREWNGLTNIWNGLAGFFSNLWQGIKNGIGAAGDIFSGLWSSMKSGFKDAANWVIDGVNTLIQGVNNVISKVPGASHLKIPNLPHLASGTSYFGGGSVLVGEQGPEVVNLPQGSKVYSNANSQNMGSNSPLVGTLNITIQAGALMGNTTDAQQFATQIYQQLQQIARRHGQAAALPNIGIMPGA